MEELLRYAVPILGVSIPLVAVAGRLIFQPLIQVLGRLADQPRGVADPAAQARIAHLEQEVAQLRGVVRQVAEEQEFRRQLEAGAPR